MSVSQAVVIVHPKAHTVTEVAYETYEHLLGPRGWLLIEDVNLDDVPEPQIWVLARARGINISHAQTKSEMITIIKEAINAGV